MGRSEKVEKRNNKNREWNDREQLKSKLMKFPYKNNKR